MKKLLILGLLLAGLLVVYGCIPPAGEEGSEALAGQAISLGCTTTSRNVQSCREISGGIEVTILYSGKTRTINYMDRCSTMGTKAYDYSCITSNSYQQCGFRCESGEQCRAGQCVSLCGNGQIDSGENCGTCTADVVCAVGQVCQEGVCATACVPSVEICDGIDNDCNGTIDEGIRDAENNIVPSCNTDENCGSFGNACAAGQTCQNGACITACIPTPEICDGIDNDCNGIADGGNTCTTNENCGTVGNVCTPGQSCQNGICLPTSNACSDSDSTDPNNFNPSLVTPGEVTTTYGTFSDFCDSTRNILTENFCEGAAKRELEFSCNSLGYGYSCIDPDGAGSSPAYCGVSNCEVPPPPPPTTLCGTRECAAGEVCFTYPNMTSVLRRCVRQWPEGHECGGFGGNRDLECLSGICADRRCVSGNQPAGSRCSVDRECASGLICRWVERNNICATPLPAGSRCSLGRECASGLTCRRVEINNICATPLPVGSQCSSNDGCTSGICGEGENGTFSVCELPGQPAGSRCNTQGADAGECASGLVCGYVEGQLICTTSLPDGSGCDPGRGRECASGICGVGESGTNVCESPGQAEGSSCNRHQECAPDLVCGDIRTSREGGFWVIRGVCEAPNQAAGTSCSSYLECASGACVNSLCT